MSETTTMYEHLLSKAEQNRFEIKRKLETLKQIGHFNQAGWDLIKEIELDLGMLADSQNEIGKYIPRD